jgi:hypothetical protein
MAGGRCKSIADIALSTGAGSNLVLMPPIKCEDAVDELGPVQIITREAESSHLGLNVLTKVRLQTVGQEHSQDGSHESRSLIMINHGLVQRLKRMDIFKCCEMLLLQAQKCFEGRCEHSEILRAKSLNEEPPGRQAVEWQM